MSFSDDVKRENMEKEREVTEHLKKMKVQC